MQKAKTGIGSKNTSSPSSRKRFRPGGYGERRSAGFRILLDDKENPAMLLVRYRLGSR
jgi:hypothetical protein